MELRSRKKVVFHFSFLCTIFNSSMTYLSVINLPSSHLSIIYLSIYVYLYHLSLYLYSLLIFLNFYNFLSNILYFLSIIYLFLSLYLSTPVTLSMYVYMYVI